jgi:hypothetical protein
MGGGGGGRLLYVQYIYVGDAFRFCNLKMGAAGSRKKVKQALQADRVMCLFRNIVFLQCLCIKKCVENNIVLVHATINL